MKQGAMLNKPVRSGAGSPTNEEAPNQTLPQLRTAGYSHQLLAWMIHTLCCWLHAAVGPLSVPEKLPAEAVLSQLVIPTVWGWGRILAPEWTWVGFVIR
ncbi:hypothetical protein DSO57_1015008 [Entomophthora muscae]|uniref:Uncharacterized protein n=1 Tax=Entomophthora muscae TaxID=34485 RepID=A0ACC2RJZ3_9FUNG|nr:hypothetical protein DSO57_1015008 [Entomophthora muscae]